MALIVVAIMIALAWMAGTTIGWALTSEPGDPFNWRVWTLPSIYYEWRDR